MKIKYTTHALERLLERNIQKSAVKAALQKGKKEIMKNGLIRSILPSNNKILIVVYYLKGLDEFLIITAYYQ
jgi:hypothetical protein